jgi:hypothetical protein
LRVQSLELACVIFVVLSLALQSRGADMHDIKQREASLNSPNTSLTHYRYAHEEVKAMTIARAESGGYETKTQPRHA